MSRRTPPPGIFQPNGDSLSESSEDIISSGSSKAKGFRKARFATGSMSPTRAGEDSVSVASSEDSLNAMESLDLEDQFDGGTNQAATRRAPNAPTAPMRQMSPRRNSLTGASPTRRVPSGEQLTSASAVANRMSPTLGRRSSLSNSSAERVTSPVGGRSAKPAMKPPRPAPAPEDVPDQGDADETGSVMSGSSAASSDEMLDKLRLILKGLKIIGDDGRLMSEEELAGVVSQSVSYAIRAMAPVAILVMDHNCQVMDMNPAAEDLLGRAREELVGRNIKMVMPSDTACKHDEYVADYLRRYSEKRGPPRSTVVNNKEGREVLCIRIVEGKQVTFPAELRVRGIPHPGGRHLPPLFFVGYIEDVSTRRELKEALEINQFIREKGDTSLIVLNDHGKVLEFNNAASKMFRYERSFVIGHNVRKLCTPDIAPVHDEYMMRFRERVASGMMHTSPVVGKTRTIQGFRPMFDDGGCERFKLELRVEAFSNGKILVAFLRDLEANISEQDFMDRTTRDTFPAHTVERLMRGEPVWDRMENTTVLFSDVESFSSKAATMEPEEVFNFVNNMVSAFDDLGYGMEKIKTIGDGYMAYFKSADDAIYTALRMLEWCQENEVRVRIGLHTGAVVSGVVGKRRRTFDMWGDVVNTAKRMEETGKSCQLQISEETFAAISDENLCEIFVEASAIVKGKGKFITYITDMSEDEMSENALSLLADRELEERQQDAIKNMKEHRKSQFM